MRRCIRLTKHTMHACDADGANEGSYGATEADTSVARAALPAPETAADNSGMSAEEQKAQYEMKFVAGSR
jgi:hypothetical protein